MNIYNHQRLGIFAQCRTFSTYFIKSHYHCDKNVKKIVVESFIITPHVYVPIQHRCLLSSTVSSTYSPTVSAIRCLQLRSFINEETYIRRGSLSREQKAREALLQYNIMIHRGIKPNVVTFTSLISVMGRANMEWQAYRLFSQMLEQGITPIPETYVALRRATKKTRKKLIDDINEKLAAVSEEMPNALVKEVNQLLKEDAEKEEAEFIEYFRMAERAIDMEKKEISSISNEGESEHYSNMNTLFDDDRDDEHVNDKEANKESPYSTVHIEHPIHVWGVHKRLSESAGDYTRKAGALSNEYNNLYIKLNKMHEEELRVFLSYNRQLRHGDKTALVKRVLQYVPVQVIEKMLRGRAKYFRAVEQVAKIQLDALKRGSNLVDEDDEVKGFNTTEHNTIRKDAEESPDLLMEMYSNAADEADEAEEDHLQPTPRTSVVADVKMDQIEVEPSHNNPLFTSEKTVGLPIETPLDKYNKSPAFLYTPWGAMRKPLKGPEPLVKAPETSGKRNISRAELEIVFEKATTGSVESIPVKVLRNYAAEFGLHWKRYIPESLANAVVHHAKYILPGVMNLSDEGVVESVPTLSGRFRAIEEERQGAQKTLEDYEAFRVISKRTGNLQVTDGRNEINTSIHQADRVSKVTGIKIEQQQRKERHLSAMEALRRGAVEYKTSSFDYSVFLKDEEARRNAGIRKGETYVIGASSMDHSEARDRNENSNSRVILGNNNGDNNNNQWSSSEEDEDPLCAKSRRLMKFREKYSDLKIQPHEVENLEYIEKLNRNNSKAGTSYFDRTLNVSGNVLNNRKVERNADEMSNDNTVNRRSLSDEDKEALLKATYRSTAASPTSRGPQELPPWMLDSASLPFNVDTGRFGNPTVGQYMELADGKVRLMPRHEASQMYTVSANLLPPEDTQQIIRHKTFYEVDKVRRTVIEDEKMQFQRFRSLRNHIARMREFDRDKSKANKGVILQPPKRVSSHLRKDKIYQRMDVTDNRINRFSIKR